MLFQLYIIILFNILHSFSLKKLIKLVEYAVEPTSIGGGVADVHRTYFVSIYN
jgi:hypothetical protein